MVCGYIMQLQLLVLTAVMLAGLNKSVSAQGNDDAAAIANATACYRSCDTLATAIVHSDTGQDALDRFKNNTRDAADDYCRPVTLAVTCYQNCSSVYQNVVAPQPTDLYNIAAMDCYTDEGKCRAYDSKLWCETYSPNLCGSYMKEYVDCYGNIQRSRNCNPTEGTFKSQRIVQTAAIEAGLYCLQVYDAFSMGGDQMTQDYIQTCQIYIPRVCMSGFSKYDIYTSGNLSCSDRQAAAECILRTLDSVIFFSGNSYINMCSMIPDNASVILYLAETVGSLPGCVLPPMENGSSIVTSQSPAESATFSLEFNNRTSLATVYTSGATMKRQLPFTALSIISGVVIAIFSS